MIVAIVHVQEAEERLMACGEEKCNCPVNASGVEPSTKDTQERDNLAKDNPKTEKFMENKDK